MNIAMYRAKQYERPFFEEAVLGFDHALRFVPTDLTEETVALSKGCTAVCCFVTD